MYLSFIFISLLIIALVDTYFYYSMSQVVKGPQRRKSVPAWLRYSYWGFTLFTLIFFLIAAYYFIAKVPPPKFARIYISGFIFIVLISKLFGVTIFLVDDLKNLILFIKRKLFPTVQASNDGSKNITRSVFIKQSGLIVSAVPFVTMMYGVLKSAFDYNVIKVKVTSSKIPPQFHGFKILQISDIHTGSFISDGPLKDAVKIINEQNADLVLFTGDLVNEVAEEALPFVNILKGINAPFGKFSVLGNHDYGDYFYQKEDLKGKLHNYSLMREIHHDMDWDLLLNDKRIIEKDGAKLGLTGVENWGAGGRFQKYGDLRLAESKADSGDFNILLSHDPSHWNSIVRYEHPEIDLTLSGHTHGFQMGVEIPGYIKWSPSQYLYEQWAGLYKDKDQMLYVNCGLGFLGYPGRLGILPEITVIELESVPV